MLQNKKILFLSVALLVFGITLGTPEPSQAFSLKLSDYFKSLWQEVLAEEVGEFTPGPIDEGKDPTLGAGQPPLMGEDLLKKDAPSGDFKPLPKLKPLNNFGRQMNGDIKRLDTLIKNGERQGLKMPVDTKNKIQKLQKTADDLEKANSPADLEGIDLTETDDTARQLDETKRDLENQTRQLQGLLRGIKGMEQQLAQFKKQLAKLSKQGLTVPSSINDTVTKAGAIIAAVKSAKNLDEAESAGAGDLQDLFQTLNESRQELELLTRWPQTVKQVDKQLAQLDRALKKAKISVDKLAKKEIDISAIYAKFEEGVKTLKASYATAKQQMESGSGEEAFQTLEDEVFGNMEDILQYQRTIEMMTNLGRFTSDFKTAMSKFDRTLKALEKKKIDVSGARDLYVQAKAKGDEIIALLKSGTADQEDVAAALEELEGLKVDLMESLQELAGDTVALPWKQGKPTQQFGELQPPTDFLKVAPHFQDNSTQ